MTRNMFIGFGTFFALVGIMSVSLGWIYNSNNAGTGYVQLALALVLFVNAYLFSQIRENDERAKVIRQKAFFYSYFFSVGYILIFGALNSTNLLPVTTYEVLTALSALMIITPSISMIILSKRM